MDGRYQTESLNSIVADALSHGEFSSFRKYWKLYKQTTPLTEIAGFFFRSEPHEGYFNLALLGEGRVIDVEGDDKENRGNLSVIGADSVEQVIFRIEPLPNLRNGQGASLTMLLKLVGRDITGPYWAAMTPEEEERLHEFAQRLIEETVGKQSRGAV